MLSAKKVQLHGIKDKRWITRDKVNQYKGLVTLFQREKAIEGYDKVVVRKQQEKIVHKLNKSLKNQRQALDNCIYGDRQEIRNCLNVDNRLKLAYQDLPIEKIIEHIHQENFNLRKTLDRLIYKIKLRTEHLIKCKLEVAQYEDTVIELKKKNKIELKSQEMSALVQDVILRKDAAIRVGVIYRKIIHFMRKDRIYFDSVLNTLRVDFYIQNDCMVQAINLGQMATEQRDDLTLEYNRVLLAVKQYQELCKKENDSNYKPKNLKQYMVKSKEQLVERCQDLRPPSPSIEHRKLEEIFSNLKQITKSSKLCEILPCMELQKELSNKFHNIIENLTKGHENLTNKVNHAQLSLSNYLCFNDEPLSYQQEVQQLKDTMEEKNKQIKEIRARQQILNHVCTKVDAAIKQIDITCNPIIIKKEVIQKSHPQFTPYYEQYPFTKLFDEITLKISYLQSVYSDLDTYCIPQRDKSLYKNLLKPLNSAMLKTTMKKQSYIQFAQAEDPLILTREGVKEKSLEYAMKAKMILEDLS
ncbi:interaptin-like [Onthophagus taurus]|uniref:interaptin-like n=1 Tax=Onthophagus taurus TaxID=166361 RepID=UPI000C1FF603|nr:uncharacterized protein LOC111417621 [Onthophagus taurus]